MSVPSTADWNENSPAGSDNIALGDERIREMKAQVREIMEIDHDFPSSATATGYHKKVTLQEQANLGTGAVGTTLLGSQTTDGKGELTYTDEADNDIQITKDGKIHAPSLGGVYPAASVAVLATMMNLIYPVGIVVTFGVSTDPATLLGVGTWTAIAGKVIVGIDGTQTEFDTLNEEGGAKTVTLDATMMPSHRHRLSSGNSDSNSDTADRLGSVNANGVGSALLGSPITQEWRDVDGRSNQLVENTGGGGAHNNLQPYIVKYVWQRVS